MNIINQYESGTSERDEFLDKAEELAEQSLSWIDPKGDNDFNAPASSIGSDSINGLASTLLTVILPPEVKFFRLQVPENIQQTFQIELNSALEDKLAAMEDKVNRFLTNINIKSIASDLLLRVLIEGNVLLILEQDVARVIPLRDFTVKRRGGKVRYVIYRELDPEATDLDSETYLYTKVNFMDDRIHQQLESESEAQEVTDVTPRQFIVVTTRIPTTQNYATGYAYNYYPTINNVNMLTERLQEAAHIAAWAVLQLPTELGISKHELKNIPSGDIIEVADGNGQRPEWITTGFKINDWAFVAQIVQESKRELEDAFAVGLVNRTRQGQKTATEILQLANELDAKVTFSASTLAETFQAPLVMAAMELLGLSLQVKDLLSEEQLKALEEEDLADGNADYDLDPETDIIATSIVAGTVALTRESQLQRLLQTIEVMGSIDPNFAAKVDTLSLFEHITSTLSINTEGIIRPNGSAIEALLQLVSSLPPEQAEQVVQMFQQFVQQLMQQQQQQQQEQPGPGPGTEPQPEPEQQQQTQGPME